MYNALFLPTIPRRGSIYTGKHHKSKRGYVIESIKIKHKINKLKMKEIINKKQKYLALRQMFCLKYLKIFIFPIKKKNKKQKKKNKIFIDEISFSQLLSNYSHLTISPICNILLKYKSELDKGSIKYSSVPLIYGKKFN